jgi:heptosyltransferase-2
MSQKRKKILILRLSSIGDVVLATHIPRIIKKAYPNAECDFITQFADLVKHNPYIDNVWVYDKKNSKQIINLDKNKQTHKFSSSQFDVILDLQNNRRSQQIINQLYNKQNNVEIYRFNKDRYNKLKMVYLKIIPKKYELIPDKYLSTYKDEKLINDGLGLEVWLPNEKDYNSNLERIENRVLIAPGAKHFTKRYPINKFISLCKLFYSKGISIDLIGGEDEIENSKELIESKYISNSFIGKLSLLETTELIANSKLLITNDSSLMHIASARKTPIIAIFGSSIKELGFTPYQSPFDIFEVDLNCRPCSHIGRTKCPKKHFNCMNRISENDIFQKAIQLLEI